MHSLSEPPQLRFINTRPCRGGGLSQRFLTTRAIRVTRILRVPAVMQTSQSIKKQNVTISLSQQTLQKAKVLAARRSTSISGLLAEQIEHLVGEDEAYERAKREALALLDRGFHLGGVIRASRDELHER